MYGIFPYIYHKHQQNMSVNTLPETNSSPLKIGRNPNGRPNLPSIHFQVLLYVMLVSGSKYTVRPMDGMGMANLTLPTMSDT